jgi:hypothetical protein
MGIKIMLKNDPLYGIFAFRYERIVQAEACSKAWNRD